MALTWVALNRDVAPFGTLGNSSASIRIQRPKHDLIQSGFECDNDVIVISARRGSVAHTESWQSCLDRGDLGSLLQKFMVERYL
jgi:hypothetical protein